MKNATPSDMAIQKILSKIEDFINHCCFYFIDGNEPNPDELFSDEKLEEMYQKIVSAIENLNNLGYIGDKEFEQVRGLLNTVDDDVLYRAGLCFDSNDVKKKLHLLDLLPTVTFEDKLDSSPFLKRFLKINDLLTKQLSREEKARKLITGLKQPVVWEQITIYFNGNEVEIKQNDRSLGVYSLTGLNFPKQKTNKGEKALRTSRGFFMALFFSTTKSVGEILSYEDNNNQKLKSSISKILCDAFNTNKDPIRKNNGIYEPIFNARFSAELRVNEHRSGGELFENQEY